MYLRFGILLSALAASLPVSAQSALEDGFSGAIRGCEEWVLNPASWAEGVEPFIAKTGLGEQMGMVSSVGEASLPPEELRVANHYWRINSTEEAGYVLVVSDRLPMCHITGGGNRDLQPVVEALLENADFQKRWLKVSEKKRGDMITTHFQNQTEPDFSMVISRAKKAGLSQDRVQVIATATLNLKD